MIALLSITAEFGLFLVTNKNCNSVVTVLCTCLILLRFDLCQKKNINLVWITHCHRTTNCSWVGNEISFAFLCFRNHNLVMNAVKHKIIPIPWFLMLSKFMPILVFFVGILRVVFNFGMVFYHTNWNSKKNNNWKERKNIKQKTTILTTITTII